MCVEKAAVAQEMVSTSPSVYEMVCMMLNGIDIDKLPHVDFKERSKLSRGVIRTGEFTPYANIILVSGVWGFD